MQTSREGSMLPTSRFPFFWGFHSLWIRQCGPHSPVHSSQGVCKCQANDRAHKWWSRPGVSDIHICALLFHQTSLTKHKSGQVSWCPPVIPVLREMRRQDCGFATSLGFIMIPYLKQNKTKPSAVEDEIISDSKMVRTRCNTKHGAFLPDSPGWTLRPVHTSAHSGSILWL